MKNFFRNIYRLASPYFRSEEWKSAWLLLMSIISLNLGIVYLSVQFNKWNIAFYDSLQNLDVAGFAAALERFSWLALIYILAGVYSAYLNQLLQIRWRRWLTGTHLNRWLEHQTYYRMQIGSNAADNPDQRISEDIRQFIELSLDLSLGLISTVVTLVSFVVILWGLSGDLPLPLGNGNTLVIPGYMVWVALVYSILGTWLTSKIGRPLVKLNFDQQRYEADFRYSLVRLRENSESIAFYKGEQQEKTGFLARFADVFDIYLRVMKRRKTLSWFTSGYGQIAVIFPYVVAAPRFFTGAIKIGGLMQTASAFNSVRGALSFVVDSFTSLAILSAVSLRLQSFGENMAAAKALEGKGASISDGASLTATNLNIRLPDGTPLQDNMQLNAPAGASLLVQGPSGCGKSTLLRVIAGLWPFADGAVTVPAGEKLFLPQKPYLPLGTLRNALLYPGRVTANDDVLRQALADCRLGHLADKLDVTGAWSHTLSLGEQQRLTFLRAIITAPAVVFLDEATSALDEDSENYFYRLLRARLPHALIVSVGHRNTLQPLHSHVLQLQKRVGA